MATTQQTVGYLPAGAEWSLAKKKRFEPVVVLVPHFGGTRLTLRRHVDFVNHLGFDAVTIQLVHNQFKQIPLVPLNSQLSFGLRHVWGEQIEDVLNHIPRKKILMTFSMPSVAALEVIQRRNASDVLGWICDGGPFTDILQSGWNLFTHAFPVKNPALRALAVGSAHYWWGSHKVREDVDQALRELPEGFPVLSVRGWQDKLVPPAMIDKVFTGHEQLNLEVLSLPEGGHLDGLAKFPLEYKPRVIRFLEFAAGKHTVDEPEPAP